MTRGEANQVLEKVGGWPSLAIALAVLAMRLGAGPWPVDDAYITFRYARNLSSGLGLVYNPGQAVLGTSTPAFALLLALLARETGADLPWGALGVSAAADAITVLLTYRLARKVKLPAWSAAMCSLTWALYPIASRYSLGGMETSVVTVLMLGAFALYISGHERWAMVPAGLAILTRPDALAAAFAILLGQAWQGRRFPWRSILILTAILSPWLIFATMEYGNPLPQSLQAKSRAIYHTLPEENALQVLYQVAGLVLAGPIGLAAQGISVYLPPGQRMLPVVAAILLLAVWGLGGLDAIRADRRWAVYFAVPLLFAGTYALLGLRGNLIAEWYLVPLAPFFFLGIFTGLVHLCRRLPTPLSLYTPIALSAVITAAQLAGLNFGRIIGANPLVPRVVWSEREELYRQAAEFIRPRLQPGDVVAAPEIGALGYHCGCRILDTVGLVSPEVAHYYPMPAHMYAVNYAVPPDLIRDKAPAYVVSLDVFIGRSLLTADWFLRDYELIGQARTSAFGSRGLLIFRRIRAAEVH
jgi:arabinofuranosyltransferase